VRTTGFLQSLEVSTVGELLALPVIRAPHKLVAAELSEVFDELQLEYSGEIVVDAPDVKLVEATGDVASRWTTIAAWLGEHKPTLLDGFHPPADASQIAAAEEAIGRTLPDDYRRFLGLHDGQDDVAPMIGTCSLFPAGELAERYADCGALFDEDEAPIDEELVAPGVRAVEYSPGWIPIGRSARGRDYLCIDLDPGEGGRVGQIIKMAVDFDARELVAPSFTDLLSVYFAGVQTGEIADDDQDDDADEDVEDGDEDAEENAE
jgi:cell wall assembly regulator SMI1